MASAVRIMLRVYSTVLTFENLLVQLPPVLGLIDECRGRCPRGYFCFAHSAICLECAVHCRRHDYPTCGEFCSASTTDATILFNFSSGGSHSIHGSHYATSTRTTDAEIVPQPSYSAISWEILIPSICIVVITVAIIAYVFVSYWRKKSMERRRDSQGQWEVENGQILTPVNPIPNQHEYEGGPLMSPVDDVIDDGETLSHNAQDVRPHEGKIAIGSSSPVNIVREQDMTR